MDAFSEKEINKTNQLVTQKKSSKESLSLNKNNESEESNNKTEIKCYGNDYVNGKYKRDSFERFGDDFCEYILSFLSLEDMMRFECISRQWNHCLYNKVFEFNYPLNPFKCFLSPIFLKEKQKYLISINIIKKCKYLKKLRITQVCDNEILGLVSQNCKFLQKINILFNNFKPIDREIMSAFAMNCGQRLESIKLSQFSKESLNSDSMFSLLIDFKEYFPKLQEIDVSLNSENCLKDFILFTDIYEQRIKSLKLRLRFSQKYKEVNQTLGQISRFQKLRKLFIIIDSGDRLEINFIQIFEQLSKNCLDLRNIDIEIMGEIYSSTSILKAFESLHDLNSLKLLIKSNGIQLGPIESLSKLSNLRQLHILYRNLNDETLNNINYYCPKLESIVLLTLEKINNKTLLSLSKIQNLKKISISGIPYKLNDITDSGLMSLLNNCKNLRIIEFNCGINVTNLIFTTLNCLAKSIPKRRYVFSFCWLPSQTPSAPYGIRFSSDYEIWPEIKFAPKNLKIKSREYWTGWCGTGMSIEMQTYQGLFCKRSVNILYS